MLMTSRLRFEVRISRTHTWTTLGLQLDDNPLGTKQADVHKTTNGLIPRSSFGVRMIEHYLPVILKVCKVQQI